MITATTAIAEATQAVDLSGAIQLVTEISGAAASGDVVMAIALACYLLTELLQGKIPGTKVQVPVIAQFTEKYVRAETKQALVFVLSAVIAGIFSLQGSDSSFVANAAMGWLTAMGMHDAVGMAKSVIGGARGK